MVSNLLRAGAMLGVCVLAVCLAACGGGGAAVVVRVAGTSIDKSTVDHWGLVIARGGTAYRQESGGTPRQRALAFLISSGWLTEEARRQGLPVSKSDVDRALAGREDVSGAAEFRHGLAETGRTVADARLEVETSLAAAAIHRQIARRAGEVTEPNVLNYYNQNPRPFRHHQTRYVQLIERLSSPSAARALVQLTGTGKAFSKLAYHEVVSRKIEARVSSSPTKEAVINAIFAARVGVVSRPMRLSNGWTVFIVRKVVPASLKPLSEVHDEVVKLLAMRREREFAKAFNSEYVRRWTALTTCARGYVVRGCAGYTGPITSEELQF